MASLPDSSIYNFERLPQPSLILEAVGQMLGRGRSLSPWGLTAYRRREGGPSNLHFSSPFFVVIFKSKFNLAAFVICFQPDTSQSHITSSLSLPT